MIILELLYKPYPHLTSDQWEMVERKLNPNHLCSCVLLEGNKGVECLCER